MALREITTTQNDMVVRTATMTQIRITENQQIYAIWTVQRGNKHRRYEIPVSETLRAQIMGRTSVQTMLDNIRDDTSGRTGA